MVFINSSFDDDIEDKENDVNEAMVDGLEGNLDEVLEDGELDDEKDPADEEGGDAEEDGEELDDEENLFEDDVEDVDYDSFDDVEDL